MHSKCKYSDQISVRIYVVFDIVSYKSCALFMSSLENIGPESGGYAIIAMCEMHAQKK